MHIDQVALCACAKHGIFPHLQQWGEVQHRTLSPRKCAAFQTVQNRHPKLVRYSLGVYRCVRVCANWYNEKVIHIDQVSLCVCTHHIFSICNREGRHSIDLPHLASAQHFRRYKNDIRNWYVSNLMLVMVLAGWWCEYFASLPPACSCCDDYIGTLVWILLYWLNFVILSGFPTHADTYIGAG